jgi:hypothetical protein
VGRATLPPHKTVTISIRRVSDRSQGEKRRTPLASTATQIDLVSLIAEQIATGIDNAVGYWLCRIERELATSGLTPNEQLRAIELILQEYKETTGKLLLRCAEA